MTLLENFWVDSDATCPSGAEQSMYVSSLHQTKTKHEQNNANGTLLNIKSGDFEAATFILKQGVTVKSVKINRTDGNTERGV